MGMGMGMGMACGVNPLDAEADDFLFDFYQHPLEGLFRPRAFLGTDSGKAGHGADEGENGIQLGLGAGEEEVDSFRGE